MLLYLFSPDAPIWGRVEDECATGDSLAHPAMAIGARERRLIRFIAHRAAKAATGDW